jgi:hypothetical protein
MTKIQPAALFLPYDIGQAIEAIQGHSIILTSRRGK